MQLVRTVGEPVDVKERDYFKQAMAGNSYVSDAIISKSTGTFMVSMAVPVYNSNNEIIGMTQRNYELADLTDILKGYDTADWADLRALRRCFGSE